MAGRQRAGAESLGDRDHRSDPDLAVATDARVRRHPCPVSLQERLDDPGAERVAEVDGQVGDPLRVGDRARRPDRIGRAAAPLAVVGRIRPELQRHGQDVGPALPLAQRRDGAVDAAADRDQNPLGPVPGRGRGAGRSSSQRPRPAPDAAPPRRGRPRARPPGSGRRAPPRPRRHRSAPPRAGRRRRRAPRPRPPPPAPPRSRCRSGGRPPPAPTAAAARSRSDRRRRRRRRYRRPFPAGARRAASRRPDRAPGPLNPRGKGSRGATGLEAGTAEPLRDTTGSACPCRRRRRWPD